jgi:hypothetical protein
VLHHGGGDDSKMDVGPKTLFSRLIRRLAPLEFHAAKSWLRLTHATPAEAF